MQYKFILLILVLALQNELLWSQNSTAQHLRHDIGVLAHDSLFGRGSGTPHEENAALFVAEEFRKAGLSPYLSEDQSFIHPFYFQNYHYFPSLFRLNDKGYSYGRDFGSVSGSSISDTIKLGIVSASGEFSREHNEDYTGKAVLLNLRGSRRWNRDLYEEDINRIKHLIHKGAAALLIYNAGNETFRDKLFNADSVPDFPVPVVYLSEALGREAEELEDAVCELSVIMNKNRKQSRNVMGFLDKGATQTIVIGAHYDHVGISGRDSAYIGNPGIHNGADDNASGTAVLMELARWAALQPDLKYNILFIAFGAEELGLYGSKHFCNSPEFNETNIAWMLNLDMVGRFDWNMKKQLFILGLGSSRDWNNHLEHINREGLSVKRIKGGPAFSDHHPFIQKGIPVIYFTTGLHNEYHKPVDDADQINYEGAARIVLYLEDLVSYMQGQASPSYRRIRGREHFYAVMRLLILK
jgi:hypothetical protein